jgi:G3E family GTPase
VKQAAVADEVVVTKVDVDAAAAEAVIARVKQLNPGARIHRSWPDHMPNPEDLSGADIYDPATKGADVTRWLNAEAYAHDAHEPGHHHHNVSRHNAEIGSFCLDFSEPLNWEHIANWLDALVLAHGDDLLRVKGIIDVVGRERPIVVQAVQRLFHPPFELPAWPPGDRKSRIVFITRNLTRDYVFEVLETIRQRRIAREPSALHSSPDAAVAASTPGEQ